MEKFINITAKPLFHIPKKDYFWKQICVRIEYTFSDFLIVLQASSDQILNSR